MKFPIVAVLASVIGVVAGAPVAVAHESDDKNTRQGVEVEAPAIAPVDTSQIPAGVRASTPPGGHCGNCARDGSWIQSRYGLFVKDGDGACEWFSRFRPGCSGDNVGEYRDEVCLPYVWTIGREEPYHVWAHYTGGTKEQCANACGHWDDGYDEGVSFAYSDIDGGSTDNSECICYQGRAYGNGRTEGHTIYECYGKWMNVCVSMVCRDELPMCDTAGSDRRLSSAHVVHVLASGQVARAEVVAALALALDGGDGFEALVDGNNATNQHAQLLVLDKDQMEYDSGEVSHPDGPFSIQNAFVHSRPDTKFRVTCPAAAEGAMCVVIDMDVEGGVPQSWFGECVLDDEQVALSDTCLDASYEVSLFSLPDSHFVLGAAGPGDDCPDVAFFGGREGSHGKRRVRFSPAAADVPSHIMGTASLRAILAAEELAPDPSASAFDLATNTCVHYAAAIWREIGFPEDAALADFIVENVARQDSSEAVARRLAEKDPAPVARDERRLAAGGKLLTAALCSLGVALSLVKDCYSAAMEASSLPRDIIEKAVYSQMEL